MTQIQLIKLIAEIFDQLKINYMLVGSFASSYYGEPRFTRDIDIVADLKLEQVEQFAQNFPENEFYLSKETIKQAIERGGMFNIFHISSGNKIDVFTPLKDPLLEKEWGRRKKILLEDFQIFSASPEYVILKKLEYYKEGESELHLKDICSMLKTSGEEIDINYISFWAEKLKVSEIWENILKKLKR